MQLAASYQAQGLKEEARLEYDAALRLRSDHIPALMARGNLAFESGDMKGAAADFRRVLRLDSRHPGANNNLAMVYLTQGKNLKKAEKHAQSALEEAGPLRPYVLETLANLSMRRSRYREAGAFLDQADAAAPADNKPLQDQLARTRRVLEAASQTSRHTKS